MGHGHHRGQCLERKYNTRELKAGGFWPLLAYSTGTLPLGDRRSRALAAAMRSASKGGWPMRLLPARWASATERGIRRVATGLQGNDATEGRDSLFAIRECAAWDEASIAGLQKRGRLAKLDLSPIRSHVFEPQTRGTNLSDIRWVLRGQVLSHSSLTAESSGMSPENIVG